MLTLEFAVSLLTCICIDSCWLNPMRHPSQTAASLHTTYYNDTSQRLEQTNTKEKCCREIILKLQNKLLHHAVCVCKSWGDSYVLLTTHHLLQPQTQNTPLVSPLPLLLQSRCFFLGLSRFSLIHGGLTKSHVPQGATKTWSTLVVQKMGWYRF